MVANLVHFSVVTSKLLCLVSTIKFNRQRRALTATTHQNPAKAAKAGGLRRDRKVTWPHGQPEKVMCVSFVLLPQATSTVGAASCVASLGVKRELAKFRSGVRFSRDAPLSGSRAVAGLAADF